MTVVVLVVIGAVIVGLVRGGSFRTLSMLRLRGWGLIIAAAGAQAAGAFAGVLGLAAPETLYVIGMVVSAALVTGFVIYNRFLPGMPMVAAGFLLNALVVAANGAMPVSLDAAARAGVAVSNVYDGIDAKHRVLGASTRLRALSDVVPVPLPYGSNVVSVGDIVLSAGIGVLVASGMRRPGPGRRARQVALGRRTDLETPQGATG
ncbi:MAG: DUF5317 domain-containing protein [Mycobacteriales bacterium]|nr:DUF5317 domain-containing protein [Frankia sp.]